MKNIYLTIIISILLKPLCAQSLVTVIFDANHLRVINENASVRIASENYHKSLLNHIKTQVEDINTNLSAVVLVKNIIHESLTHIDEGLKSSIQVVGITRIVEDIYNQSNEILQQAAQAPWLLLFAEQASRSFKDRSIKLAVEVSDFILKEGAKILMDYQKRDYLLSKISLELKVIRALMFSMHRSIYWAKVNGIIKSVNPYASFINMDKQKADEILRFFNMLK
ncbi:hypothetical protein [Sphingobacterium bovistauri]|uniref:Plasmid transfer protein n=1 Tax=Sphingobacterium bovistauri TaxID=2781959 RepID=A0ABS7Z1J6_9SPHI|nr:hypothetical protein [Sphingobacterium bovistauri]MCA5004043.1 hypothetical protein [Sphingobacterium bovistauri]